MDGHIVSYWQHKLEEFGDYKVEIGPYNLDTEEFEVNISKKVVKKVVEWKNVDKILSDFYKKELRRQKINKLL